MIIVLFTFLIITFPWGDGAMARTLKSRKKWPPVNYLVYYGGWDEDRIAQARGFDLVILHPGKTLSNITRETVRALQAGKDGVEGNADDISVIAYVSIGEDEEVPRGPGEPVKEEAGPVCKGDGGKGPVFIHNNYPPRYLDEMSYVLSDNGFFSRLPTGLPALRKGHDGIPDENGIWGSFYVNAGDPEWHKILIAKMHRLIQEFGVDGFFLDTLDTASPWGNYGWTQRDMALLVQRLHNRFNDRLIIVNRGLFLFENYADIMRSSIDGLVFESFLTEWNWGGKIGIASPYVRENNRILRQNILPQASKDDGFHLFFLNYADSGQKDFYSFLYDESELLSGTPAYSAYFTTPDLQSISPPPATYYAESSLPHLMDFSVIDDGKGSFTLSFLLKDDAGQEALPQKDFYFDARYSDRELARDSIPMAQSVDIDYSRISVERDYTGRTFSYTTSGLDKGKLYYFHGRIIGKSPKVKIPYKSAVLRSGEGDYPGRSLPLISKPRHTPPQPPSNLAVHVEEATLHVAWDKPAFNDLKEYRLYCFPSAKGLRLPYIVPQSQNSMDIPNLARGTSYTVFVTAVNSDNIESDPAEGGKKILIP
jgi:endo-alpha-1,4-polygalactosaminidase (GH114 family)